MKKYIALIISILLCSVLFVGCDSNDKIPDSSDSPVDYSEYAFVDASWTRDVEEDVETIRFGADGSFTYSCSCGNSVNDSDLCEGYTYDDATKTITLDCIETTDEMITIIKIVKCDDNELQLDFDGEIRTFTK